MTKQGEHAALPARDGGQHRADETRRVSAGPHYKVVFRGFPERYYGPTFPLEGCHDERVLRLHIKRVADGQVSPALGREIGVGHGVKLTSALGMAFFRPGHSGRVMLVAGGMGYARRERW